MYDMKKARCDECPHHLEYREKEAKRKHGTTMRPGCRYCLAGKRARLFKKKDPKVYVPKWCPKRISPPILRVYSQRDGVLHYRRVYVKDRKMTWPDAEGYALRFEGKAPYIGRFFYTIIHNREKDHFVDADEIAEELSAPVAWKDVIEFDDGVKPMFYWCESSGLCQIVFDRDQAEGYPPKSESNAKI